MKKKAVRPFEMTEAHMKAALDELARRDPVIAHAVEAAGYPQSRRVPLTFASLLRVIAGQQLSTKAAATIFERVRVACGDECTPASLLALDEQVLRGCGLSGRKVEYARALAAAIVGGALPLDALHSLSDDEVIATLVAVKGVGRWTAQIVLMFGLGRPDVWPVADLGVRGAVGKLLGMETRPTPTELEAIGERWRPYRSTVAVMAWYYLRNAPV